MIIFENTRNRKALQKTAKYIGELLIKSYVIHGVQNTDTVDTRKLNIKSGDDAVDALLKSGMFIMLRLDNGTVKGAYKTDNINRSPFLAHGTINLFVPDNHTKLDKRQFISTLTHELQHAFDSHRTKNDEFVKGGKTGVDGALNGEHKSYLVMPHEINARYTQTVGDIYMRTTFQKVLDKFKDNIGGWELFDDKTKKRLSARLFDEYTTANKFIKLTKSYILKNIRGISDIEFEIDVSMKYLYITDSKIKNLKNYQELVDLCKKSGYNYIVIEPSTVDERYRNAVIAMGVYEDDVITIYLNNL